MNTSIGRRGSRSGIALLYAVMAAFIAAAFIAVTVAAASVANRNAQVQRYDTQAQYLAEGAVETAKKQIQTAIANWSPVPAGGSVQVGGQMVNYSIVPTGFVATNTDPSGVQTLVTAYELNADAEINGAQSGAHRIINAMATPLFQFAVFYDSDLEVLPGPNMTIRGRVHSNRDLYLGCGNGSTLTLNTNYVHAAGNIYRNRKDNPALSEGTVSIRNWVANPFNAAEPSVFRQMNSQTQMGGVSTVSGYDSRFTAGFDANNNGVFTDTGDWLPFAPGALAYWAQPSGYGQSGHTVMTHEHGVTESVVPSMGSTAMYEPTGSGTGGDYAWDAANQRFVQVANGTGAYREGYYHDHADLSIIAFADGTWKAYDNAGTEVTSSVSSAVSMQQMYDARQANGSSTKIKVLQIDMQLLGGTGRYPANGLLYAAHYGEGTGLNAKGVRLKNGSTLLSKLTVATPDPMYIWGNYNTVAEKPASVICDALNLLSSAWNDTKTSTSGLPEAGDTTYNVAVVTGNLDTVGTNYNGGLENLPRFHEDWSRNSHVCTIKGSFVKPWFSQYGTSAWVYGGNRYTAPVRNWSYNTAFNNVANLPPFTPMAVTAEDIVSW